MADEATPIISAVSRNLASFLATEINQQYAIKYKIERLQLYLDWCRYMLLDHGEEKKTNSQPIREWIPQIRECAYKAGQIIDKLELVLISLSRKESRLIWKPFCRHRFRDVSYDIDTLSRQIPELAWSMRFHGVSEALSSLNWVYKKSGHLTTPAWEELVPSFEDDSAHSLIAQLVNSQQKVFVIYGKRGSGITTLAKQVYLNGTVRDHFASFVWITLTLEIGNRQVLESILLELNGGDYSDQRKKIVGVEDDTLKRMIKDSLKTKTLLLVLDNIQHEWSWLRLQSDLSSLQTPGSKLLITTSNEAVKLKLTNESIHAYEPSSLHIDQRWELLRYTASKGGFQIDAEMEKCGREMVSKCENIRLAIMLLGGILAFKKTIDEWKCVHRSIVEKVKQDSVLKDIIELSYSELRTPLGSCLLLLASLPDDITLPINIWYRIWAAQGLVMTSSTEGSKPPEDIADKYVKELVNRGLVQARSWGDRGAKGRMRAFEMRDLIRRRLREKKGVAVNWLSINSAEFKEMGNAESIKININIRRLDGLVVRNNTMDVDQDESQSIVMPDVIIQNCQQLKSLLFLTNTPNGVLPMGWLESLVEVCKALEVLHLEYARISSFPKSIAKLIHIRYLSLKLTIVEHELPSSIGDLGLLEMLDLRIYGTQGLQPVVLPIAVGKLTKLRFLYLPESYICKKFRKLRVNRLKNLETLKNLNLRHCRVTDLLLLSSITKLSWKTYEGEDLFEYEDKESLLMLLKCPNVESGGLKKKLIMKIKGELLNDKYLTRLALFPGFQMTVEGLIIHGPFSGRDIGHVFEKLTYLVLRQTEFENDPMPIINILTNLKRLRLSHRSFIGEKMSCSVGGFPNLVYLKLDLLPNLLEWEMEPKALPQLKLLEIDYCCKLQKLPDQLPKVVKVRCLSPCISGHKRHGTCPYNEDP